MGGTEEVVTISRENLFNGYGRRGPAFSWLYTVTVPGERHPFVGKGVDWARGIARKYAAGRRIVETWK